jgi:NAD(P)-dependent dehydrogenase (short-subunit alcohol dehydrogenase family)
MMHSAHPLRGTSVLVTGGASGIGRATCRELAARGASLCIADRNLVALEETRSALAADNPEQPIHTQTVDVRDPAAVQEMVRAALDKLGRLDALVHCAGILRGPGGTPRLMHDTPVEEFDAVVGTNLRGTFLCNRAVLPVMIKQRAGHIINVASTSGIQGRPFDSVYCASKFGVVGLTESVREEVRSFGIRVHAVLPDAVDTPLWEQNGPIHAPDFALSPDRVAGVIAYLLSLPEDVILGNLIVAPVRAKRRRGASKAAAAEPNS